MVSLTGILNPHSVKIKIYTAFLTKLRRLTVGFILEKISFDEESRRSMHYQVQVAGQVEMLTSIPLQIILFGLPNVVNNQEYNGIHTRRMHAGHGTSLPFLFSHKSTPKFDGF